MNACSPPSARDEIVAGPHVQMVGVGEHDLGAESAEPRRTSRALIAARVPTGMNAGVSTAPCASRQAAAARATVSVR